MPQWDKTLVMIWEGEGGAVPKHATHDERAGWDRNGHDPSATLTQRHGNGRRDEPDRYR
jgi:hypothetical protein